MSATTPRNKRLNQEDRTALINFAQKNVTAPEAKASLDAAYKEAKKVVMQVVREKYPAKDMKVLEKYGAAEADKCIRYGSPYDHESAFIFFDDDNDAPLVPRRQGCHQRIHIWSIEQRAILDTYQLARQAFKKAKDEKLNAYTRLIIGSSTFNDLVAIWPAAEGLRSKIIPVTPQQRALAVLSAETIAMIRTDNAGAGRGGASEGEAQ